MSKRPSKKAGASTRPRPRTTKQAAAQPIEIAPPKRGRGRPSSYDPAFCERVIELGEQGKSKAQIARALGISRKSLYLWMRVHEEFKEAMQEAEFAALAWFEDIGQAGLSMPKFNAALYAFQMKNRFREFYADKVDVARTGAPEEPEMSDLDIARRIAFVFGEAMQQRKQQEQGAPQVVVDGPWPALIHKQ